MNLQKKYFWLILPVALLLAVGAGFLPGINMGSIWYGYPNPGIIKNVSYQPVAQENWGPFTCGGSVVGASSAFNPVNQSSTSSTGFAATLDGINTKALKQYNRKSIIQSDLIDKNKNLIKNEFNDHLFWGSTCNRMGKPILGGVRNQGSSGTCWAFATVTAISAFITGKTNRYLALSPQYLWNECGAQCATEGSFYSAIMTLSKGIGLPKETSCAYAETQSSSCVNESNQPVQLGENDLVIPQNEIVEAFIIYPGSVGEFNTQLKQLLQIYGPLPVSLAACQECPGCFLGPGGCGAGADLSYAKDYKTLGLPMGYNDDHEVLLVGYSKTGDQPYWIIQNSWGDAWGMGGFSAIGMSRSPEKMQIGAIFGTIGGIINAPYNNSLIESEGKAISSIKL